MEMVRLLRLVFMVGFAAVVPAIRGDFELDGYWRQRAEDAGNNSIQAYHSDPYEIVGHFHERHYENSTDVDEIEQVGEETDNTRRSLRGRTRGKWNKLGGPCTASNPIDKCWRCKRNWAKDRKRLARCVRGFGHKTVGGRDGRIYVVTDNSDSDLVNPKPGTLRHAVIQKEPLWIIFSHHMFIRLNQELIISSYKTIDARGAHVHIAYGAGITIQFVQHVIIHGLKIHHIVQGSGGMVRDSVDHYGYRGQSDGDGISIFGSTNVWIDHVSMSRCQDGLIDVIQGSTGVTISNCHFTHHNDVMLLGANNQNEQDKIMQVTVAYNHFGKGLVQRMPRCRWGFFHVVNNDYTHWELYAIGGSQNPTILSHGNRFIAPPQIPQYNEVTKRDYASPAEWSHWIWRSEKDVFMNGAFFRESGDPKFHHHFSRQDMIKPKHGLAVSKLTKYAGALNCKVGKRC